MNVIVKAVAAIALAATAQTGCQAHGPKIQNQDVQDVSKFAQCDDLQGHGPTHPCTTRKTDGTWIVWVVGVADCPAITLQPKDDVKCLNEQK